VSAASADPRETFLADPLLRAGTVAGAAWLIGYAIATGIVAGDQHAQMLLGDLVYLVPLVAATTLTLLAATRLSGRARLFWLIVGTSLVLLLAGECVWSYDELVLGIETPTPSLADAGYLAAYVTVIPAAVIGFGEASGERHLRAWLDAGIVTVGLGAAGWRLLISPQLGHGFTAEVASQIAYPLLDTALLILLVSLGFAGHRNVSLSVGLVAVAYAVAALGDAVYSFLTIHGLFESGGWVDLSWQVQLVLLCLAAGSAMRLRGADPTVRVFQRDLGLVLVLGGVALALVVVAVDLGRAGAGGTAGLVAIVLTVSGLVARLQLTVRDLRKIGLALDAALREQARLAVTDELTSLHNRRYFVDAIRSEVHRGASDGKAVGLLVVDLDRFKEVNDTYGHDAGDLVLTEVAGRLAANVRLGDVVARYGGEEFVVLLPGAGSDVVAAIGERCRQALEAEPVPLKDGTRVAVTASLGGCSSDLITPTREELIRLADRAMYEAKRRGRNQLVMAAP
jgi:diguanylate cyclase (GGDEF)-like protein